jgi:hypothetical protein
MEPGRYIFFTTVYFEASVRYTLYGQATYHTELSAMQALAASRSQIVHGYGDPNAGAEVSAGSTQADKGMLTGVSVGALLGGIAGLAALAIPGVGALLAAGPIAAALGAMSGAALGGRVGAFSGLGVPNEEAIAFDEAGEARARGRMEQHRPRKLGSYNQAL